MTHKVEQRPLTAATIAEFVGKAQEVDTLEQEATPGPWEFIRTNSGNSSCAGYGLVLSGEWDVRKRLTWSVFIEEHEGFSAEAKTQAQKDGEFIEAARVDIPRLTAAIIALAAEVDRMRHELRVSEDRNRDNEAEIARLCLEIVPLRNDIRSQLP